MWKLQSNMTAAFFPAVFIKQDRKMPFLLPDGETGQIIISL